MQKKMILKEKDIISKSRIAKMKQTLAKFKTVFSNEQVDMFNQITDSVYRSIYKLYRIYNI